MIDNETFNSAELERELSDYRRSLDAENQASTPDEWEPETSEELAHSMLGLDDVEVTVIDASLPGHQGPPLIATMVRVISEPI